MSTASKKRSAYPEEHSRAPKQPELTKPCIDLPHCHYSRPLPDAVFSRYCETFDTGTTRRYVGPLVTIIAGSELTETFLVHETLLNRGKTFFVPALDKDRWKEGATRVIHFPDDESDTVRTYLQWLYSNKIASVVSGAEHMTKDESDAVDLHLAKCYGFGEKLLDKRFCLAVIQTWTKRLDQRIEGKYRYFAPDSLKVIYETTPESSMVRSFIHKIIRQYAGRKWFTKTYRDLGMEYPEFLLACLIARLYGDEGYKRPDWESVTTWLHGL